MRKKVTLLINSSKKDTSSPRKLIMQRRILIIDDDPGIRDIFRIIFERAGYDLEIKENGRDILENKFEHPHLFLIDNQLSGVSGIECAAI